MLMYIGPAMHPTGSCKVYFLGNCLTNRQMDTSKITQTELLDLKEDVMFVGFRLCSSRSSQITPQKVKDVALRKKQGDTLDLIVIPLRLPNHSNILHYLIV